MKKIILSLAIALTAIVATAQMNVPPKSVNYEAANWNTWLLDNPQQITIAAPPTGVQSKSELQLIKKRMEKMDEKKWAAIRYWNAGAPSYRWNQITPKLIDQRTAASAPAKALPLRRRTIRERKISPSATCLYPMAPCCRATCQPP